MENKTNTQQEKRGKEWKTQDGWDLNEIFPLGDASLAIIDIGGLNYELENCVRTMSIVEMRDSLIAAAQRIIDAAEQIEDDDTIKEVKEWKYLEKQSERNQGG